MTSELRIKIAESLGWRTKENHGSIGGYFAISPDGDTDWYMTGLTPESAIEQVCPDYQNDPSAALTLVEALAKEGWEVQILGPRGDWQCTFYQTAAPNWFEWIDAHSKSAPTLPEAICNAYCKVKGIA